jgi:hypothetical protein
VNFSAELQLDRLTRSHGGAGLDEHPQSRQIQHDPRVAALPDPQPAGNALSKSGLRLGNHGNPPDQRCSAPWGPDRRSGKTAHRAALQPLFSGMCVGTLSRDGSSGGPSAAAFRLSRRNLLRKNAPQVHARTPFLRPGPLRLAKGLRHTARIKPLAASHGGRCAPP